VAKGATASSGNAGVGATGAKPASTAAVAGDSLEGAGLAQVDGALVSTTVPAMEFNGSPSNMSDWNATLPNATPWIEGTWTTGYWDCCKPSCSWPGKGNVDRPARACDARTGLTIQDRNARSVCGGGTAASCQNYQPFLVNRNLAYGFAAAVSGSSGLTGDTNCGQCYELQFVDRRHQGGWGGANPHLVNKSMVIQVTNIGYDVNGEHSFDLQVPGAGQGLFSDGCAREYPGYSPGDFDCDNRYGGCADIKGCSRLPPGLRPGCEWRYNWYYWLRQDGQTNNPFVRFHRVRCPSEITAISGSTPLDDELFRPADPFEYV